MKTVRSWRPSLSTRLVVLLTLALLPLGLISVYQTWAVARETDALAARALLAEAENAATEERNLLYEGLGSAEVIASAVGQTDFDPGFCSVLVKQFIEARDVFVWAGVLETNGVVRCSSNDVQLQLEDRGEIMQRANSRGRGFFSLRKGPASGESVLVSYAPTFQDGELLGLTAVSIPHDIANRKLADGTDGLDFTMTTLNPDGEILSSSAGLDTARDLLPEDLPMAELANLVDTTFESTSGAGERQLYAVSALIDNEVILVASKPVLTGEGLLPVSRSRIALVFPLLMWAASLAVALFGLHRLVLRHLRDLRSAMRRFALGERDDPLLNLKDAPPELREAQRAFNRMVYILTEAENRTQRDLQEKTILLREVHHRVKNNLQMVASIMNLQMRKAQSTEAKQVLMQLQNRVRGLATIHRSLFTTPEEARVNGGDLVRELIDEIGIAQFAKRNDVTLQTDLADVRLYPDQAVPLSMFLSEAMTNAMKYIGTPEGADQARLAITLSVADDTIVTLTIENTLGPRDPEAEQATCLGNGLGSRLMQAFVRQLEGTEKIEHTTSIYRHEIWFMAVDPQDETRTNALDDAPPS